MTTQHSDPPREPTDTNSEVLSDATDLDALLEAILGDQVAPEAAEGLSRDEVASAAVIEGARSEPSVVPPPARIDPEPDRGPAPEPAAARGAIADDNDGWGFVSEDSPAGDEIAHDASAVRQYAVAAVVPPTSQRTWRDKLPVSLSKKSLLVAGLSAAALIIASAIRLGGELTATETATATETIASAEAPALVPPSSAPVLVPSVVRATDSSEVEVWAAAREPEGKPRAINRTASRRNEVTDQRTTAPTTPAFVEAPTAPPVVTAPALADRIAEPIDRNAAPSRPVTPEVEQPRPTNAEPAPSATSAAGVVNGAEPAPTAAAPVPASVPRRSAARLLTGSAPEYPAALRTARVGGSVEVRFTIDSSGRVINVQSLSGPLQLRAAAEAAVRRWRYEAARLDNVAVETQTSVRFNFEPAPDRRPQE